MGTRGNAHLFVGKAGQLAVMSELAWRGYNVALPEIDIGEDVYSVNQNGQMSRIQVKTASAHSMKRTREYRFGFHISRKAIMTPSSPELHFVFALRVDNRFRFVVISRESLRLYVERDDAGSPGDQKTDGRRFDIYISDKEKVRCGKDIDWTTHLEDWHNWPDLIGPCKKSCVS